MTEDKIQKPCLDDKEESVGESIITDKGWRGSTSTQRENAI